MALKYSRPLYYVEIYIVGYREYATDGESQSCLPLKENTILEEGTGHFWHSFSLLLLFLLNQFVLCKMSSSVYIQKLNEGNITIWIIQIQLSRSHFIVLVSICLVYDFLNKVITLYLFHSSKSQLQIYLEKMRTLCKHISSKNYCSWKEINSNMKYSIFKFILFTSILFLSLNEEPIWMYT